MKFHEISIIYLKFHEIHEIHLIRAFRSRAGPGDGKRVYASEVVLSVGEA